jgi:hypothetical protein
MNSLQLYYNMFDSLFVYHCRMLLNMVTLVHMDPVDKLGKTKYLLSYFILYLFKPSQGGDCWHICVWVLFPPHVLHGVLVFKYKQDRLRVWLPWPHVVLHDDHVDQLKYEQSIGGKKNKKIHFKENQEILLEQLLDITNACGVLSALLFVRMHWYVRHVEDPCQTSPTYRYIENKSVSEVDLILYIQHILYYSLHNNHNHTIIRMNW